MLFLWSSLNSQSRDINIQYKWMVEHRWQRPPFWTFRLSFPSKVSTVKMVCGWSALPIWVSTLTKVDTWKLCAEFYVSMRESTNGSNYTEMSWFRSEMTLLINAGLTRLLIWVGWVTWLQAWSPVLSHTVSLRSLILPPPSLSLTLSPFSHSTPLSPPISWSSVVSSGVCCPHPSVFMCVESLCPCLSPFRFVCMCVCVVYSLHPWLWAVNPANTIAHHSTQHTA